MKKFTYLCCEIQEQGEAVTFVLAGISKAIVSISSWSLLFFSFFLLSFFFFHKWNLKELRNCQSNYLISTSRKNYYFSTVSQFPLRWARDHVRWERFWSHKQHLSIMTTKSERKYGNGLLICALICKNKEVARYQGFWGVVFFCLVFFYCKGNWIIVWGFRSAEQNFLFLVTL